MFIPVRHLLSFLVTYSICDVTYGALIRLRGGSTPNEGRVEVYYSGTWGTICDDSWDNNDATTACRMLGYTTGYAYHAAHFGPGTGPIWLDDLKCYDYTMSLWSCSGNDWGVNNCGHGEDAGVSCNNSDRVIRLRDGGAPNRGRVEVLYSNIWGTICEDFWDDRDATVACWMLGYTTGKAFKSAYFGQGTGQIWLDNLECDSYGYEHSLWDCSGREWGNHDCTHRQDAGVSCDNSGDNNWARVRLQGGIAPDRGRVEVLYNKRWGTVCDDEFDNLDATVFCRMLGYTNGRAYRSAYFGQGRGQIWLDNLRCGEDKRSVWSCSGNEWGSHNCGHGDDAGVWCSKSGYGLVLDSGHKPNVGTLLVSLNNNWGTVCDNHFDDKDADVACRELGYSSGGVAYGQATLGQGFGVIWLDELECNGTESDLSLCPHSPWGTGSCSHNKDAGVYCYLGSWSSWTSCSVTCGDGTRTRRILCSGSDSSSYCKPREESIKCNEKPCPVNGNWATWESWSSCTVACGNGTRTRLRSCTDPAPKYDGRDCIGEYNETYQCVIGTANPVHGKWSSWEAWSSCTATCENGTRTRVRNCSDPEPACGGQNCTGNQEERASCITGLSCPVHGKWASWEAWSSCTVTCENGTRTRVRDCSDPEPAHGGQQCTGDDKETDKCHTGIPCPVHGKWASWEAWSSCTVTCEKGTHKRMRNCDNPEPAHGGQQCTGKERETYQCDTGIPCPVDGHWASWELWSACSVTCDNGTRTRIRDCSDPAPVYNGQHCTGQEKEIESCKTGLSCPVDGQWGSWAVWSSCSMTCENGTRTRVRECSDPVPAYGGQNCTGEDKDIDQCTTGLHCPVDGQWGSWEAWSICSVTCETGTRSRVRYCSDPAPAYGGQNCVGENKEDNLYVTGIPCPVIGQWGNWMEWSTCSATCECGHQHRSRVCRPSRKEDHKPMCNGSKNETKICNTTILCPGACGEGNRMCDDKRTCIPSEMSCDGVEHCPGGEDELYCLENTLLFSTPLNFPSSDAVSASGYRFQNILHLFMLTAVAYGFAFS